MPRGTERQRPGPTSSIRTRPSRAFRAATCSTDSPATVRIVSSAGYRPSSSLTGFSTASCSRHSPRLSAMISRWRVKNTRHGVCTNPDGSSSCYRRSDRCLQQIIELHARSEHPAINTGQIMPAMSRERTVHLSGRQFSADSAQICGISDPNTPAALVQPAKKCSSATAGAVGPAAAAAAAADGLGPPGEGGLGGASAMIRLQMSSSSSSNVVPSCAPRASRAVCTAPPSRYGQSLLTAANGCSGQPQAGSSAWARAFSRPHPPTHHTRTPHVARQFAHRDLQRQHLNVTKVLSCHWKSTSLPLPPRRRQRR